jgi:hypothetical protein
MHNNDVGEKFIKRHFHECHPLFYFMRFISLYSPLSDIVIVHIFYINESIHLILKPTVRVIVEPMPVNVYPPSKIHPFHRAHTKPKAKGFLYWRFWMCKPLKGFWTFKGSAGFL